MAMRGGSWLGVVAALCAAGMPSRGAVLVVTPGLLLLGREEATWTSAAGVLRIYSDFNFVVATWPFFVS